MIKLFKDHLKELFLTVMVMLSIILVCAVLMLTNNYSEGLYKQAVDSAEFYGKNYRDLMDEKLEDLVEESREIAANLPETDREIGSYLYKVADQRYEEMAFIRVFANGMEFPENTTSFEEKYAMDEGNESESLLQIVRKNEIGVSTIITDNRNNSTIFAVYIPTPNNEIVDGIAVFYFSAALDARFLADFKVPENQVPPSCLFLCDANTTIYKILYGESFSYVGLLDNFSEKLREFGTLTVSDEFYEKRTNGYSTELTLDGEKYVLTVHPSKYAKEGICFVSFFKSYDVYEEGHSLSSTIGAIIITILLIVIALSVYIVVAKLRLSKQVEKLENNDVEFNCPSLAKFLKEATGYLGQFRGAKFAVICIQINHYSYILESLGNDTAKVSILFLIRLLEKTVGSAECFGHISNENFALLLRYKDMEDLKNRLKNVADVAYNCPALKQKNFFMQLLMGVYCNEMDSSITVQQMLDRAEVAIRSDSATKEGNIKVYDQTTHEKFLHEALIEQIMRSSLEKGEFKVFFQPKFNVAKNRPDGAESLVRWFDPENNRFRTPPEFIPIFEANGFIAEVDKYVFNEVCKFVKESQANGYRMIPLSVNVSRTTALKPGFVETFTQIKRQYGIVDRFITLEFAESFANENYEFVSDIVNRCHKAGFLCSIDNFGSGFSSYNILKDLPMDELKLDRFFILPGTSGERDNKLLHSVIQLAKNMNMKVTQQGVESVDDFKKLANYGCDVVQGFIYSKPIPATDYVQFIQSGGQMTII